MLGTLSLKARPWLETLSALLSHRIPCARAQTTSLRSRGDSMRPGMAQCGGPLGAVFACFPCL